MEVHSFSSFKGGFGVAGAGDSVFGVWGFGECASGSRPTGVSGVVRGFGKRKPPKLRRP